MRVNVPTSLTIEAFSGGVVTRKVSGTKNAIYKKRADGTVYATQRPGVNIFEDASESVSDTKGRGEYYWDAVGAKYFVNADTVYKSSYANPLAANLTTGIERVEFFEVGDYLVIIDAENNEGWYIAKGSSTTLTEITDTDFPPKQTPALTLCRGGCSLNGTLYVGCTNGEIWNSAVEDPTTWASADFTNAEVSPDDGVMLFPHNDNIAFLGTRSCQFFYDNANPTGSPLNTRLDVFHEIGAANFNSHWVQMNLAYFVGQTSSGSLGVYALSGFNLQPISNDNFNSMLTTALVNDGGKCVGSGLTAGDKAFYVLTIYFEDGGIVDSAATYVFDSDGQLSEWELAHTGLSHFPLIDWTKASSTRAGEGILANGDLVTVYDTLIPQDTTSGDDYILEGYITDGYYTKTPDSGADVSMEIVFGQGDSGTLQTKFADGLKVVCTPTDSTANATVQWSDEGNNNYNTGKTIDLSNPKNRINRLGSYKLRNYKLTYTGSEQCEIEGLEVNVV